LPTRASTEILTLLDLLSVITSIDPSLLKICNLQPFRSSDQ